MSRLTHDPIPWLLRQEGERAVRARRALGLEREGDEERVLAMRSELAGSQLADGSFGGSVLKTAGVLNLLGDMHAPDCDRLVEGGVGYLVCVLKSQPGYARAERVRPGSLKGPCDLCGFFGPYGDRNVPRVMAEGAREMNFHREFEPLLGPKTRVRGSRRSSRDRAGPSSCYSWGLVPLAYTVEAICRAGRSGEPGLAGAVNALLGAQRASGGWCRNPGGHPNCTLHALRALGAHPRLRVSVHAERALQFLSTTWKPISLFGMLEAVARFGSPTAHALLRAMLSQAAARQRRNGSFGTPCAVDRVAAVIMALRSVGDAQDLPTKA